MRTVTQILAWDVVFVHLSSAALFIGLHVLIFINAGEHFWWVLAFLLPILTISLAGWGIEMQILLRGTAELRRKGGSWHGRAT